jgi:transposase-like protein
VKCPKCGSENIKQAGKYKGKYKASQGYRCKDCERYFVERDGFEGKHYSKEVIVRALHLYAGGSRLRKSTITSAAFQLLASPVDDLGMGARIFEAPLAFCREA